MKRCLICMTEAEDDALTCANCGHGSWGVKHQEHPKFIDTVIVDEPEESKTDTPRRGARRRKGRR